MLTTLQISSMSINELLDLNKVIVAQIKARQKKVQVQAAAKLVVGQKVTWTGKRGTQVGVVTKVKIKMVEVNAGLGGLWNVTASMLKAV